MKIGEWDSLGPVRALLQRQLGELAASDLATHVTVGDNGRLRILTATEVGLLDYSWVPSLGGTESGMLHGQVYRWANVQGLRLQTDAAFETASSQSRSIWHLVAQEPKIELRGTATPETGDREVRALLDFARACFARAG